jgi:hypothetical protein
MSIEELLYPRYQVSMEGYPNMQFKRGEILTLSDATEQGMPCMHYDNTGFGKGFFDKFPSIFRPVKWWEYREESEAPSHVKFNRDFIDFRLGQVAIFTNYSHKETGGPIIWINDKYGIPANSGVLDIATEEEYLNYINSNK